MSIGGLGGISSLAAASTAQRTSDVDKTQTAAGEKSRVEAAAEYAEQASGIGETKEESESSDRDADGRRLWEFGERQPTEEETAAEALKSSLEKDPTGDRGGQLDLSG
jgi:hypothetical protein